MACRLTVTLVLAAICASFGASTVAAQNLTPGERASLDDWYRRTSERTGRGAWGVAIATMDGRILWSLSPE
ncbi:MAG TPA: hypothetical protein VMY76_00545, partial [Gemmatimonadales bacterium]|nr:hypothetical protein [Gemmatimonadales bacterium]